MKWNSHDTISKIKCFLNTITMMNINIDIEYTFMISKSILSLKNIDKYFLIYFNNSRIAMTISFI